LASWFLEAAFAKEVLRMLPDTSKQAHYRNIKSRKK